MRTLRLVIAAGLALGVLALGGPAQAAARTFQTQCTFDPVSPHRALDDPIVNPAGDAAHMHDFFGNLSTNRNSTYADMVAAGTSCVLSADTAAYWIPALSKPDGTMVSPKFANVYYRSANNSTPVTPFPANYRVIAGPSTSLSNVFWSCTASSTRLAAPGPCGKARVRATLNFPSCGALDEVGALLTDSADHRAHATYPTKGVCPSSYPVLLPRLTIEIRWNVADGTGYTLSSGAPSTMHADFWNTWQQSELERHVLECLNQSIGCGKLTD